MRKSTVGPCDRWRGAAGVLELRDLLARRARPTGAIDSAWSTPASKAAVRLANGWPLMWNVLFVDPCTPGQRPVARLNQPAPVFGGAWVSRPPPDADAPFFRSSAIAGIAVAAGAA